ncbi:MAG: Stk1 family PASTA domain-containing Ser/Thr kinase [Oscillospiraceae bacterium]|nr:Stk1 family PASTA domain-containing Ser/Thr kinase [Oscillospiraceae bacterium]
MDKDKYIGRLLDNRYEILEVIGTGGMAVVYKARCHRLNRLVAVKILKDDNLDDEDFRRRFHAESQAVAMLSHPNIVSVYDVSTSVMADYIVMELCEGITLKQYMEKKGILNWKETLHFAMQIAKALEHAHSKGIVHRDIKPHNVMVLKNGSVKVMDFGIARLISRGNTLTKEALGSVHYISPEQARGGRVDDRSDIYSLGVVMYEMMAGRPPYDGESPVSVAIQHINGGAALPSVLNPNIPGGLEQIIMKAMAHNVSDRYPSATRMLADMDEFRKDPTILFDYTGLPLDAAMRVQNPTLVLQPADPVNKPDEEQTTGKKSPETNTPSERRREDSSRRTPGGNTGRTPSGVPNHKPRRRPSPQDEKRTRMTTIAIIVCSLVAVIAIGIVLALALGGGFAPKKKMVEVPNLVGKTYAQLPAYDGLSIMKEERYDDSVAAGTIISQKPEPGTKVTQPSIVVVNVSLGPAQNTVTMTDLTERSKDWATSYLNGQKIGLTVEIKEEYNDTVADGYVIRTEPKADAKLTQGQTVTLYISKGKKVQIAAMPNLVNENVEAAKNTLELQQLDLKIKLDEVYDMTAPAGTVLATTPGKGEKLKTGQEVILKVSLGVEKKIVPDMMGMELNKAKDMLKQLGFKEPIVTHVDSDQPKDTVVGQSLEKDVEHEIVAQMTLQVSNGSKAPVTKDVTLDLKGSAKLDECRVEIKRDNQVIYTGKVPKGTVSVVLPNQTAAGSVVYHIIINEMDGWDETVLFTANG